MLVVVPLYIVEIAPGRWRGLLVGLNQLNIVFGILASYVTNYLVARYMPDFDPRIVWRGGDDRRALSRRLAAFPPVAERDGDGEVLLLEAAVAEKGLAERADADERSVRLREEILA